MWKLVAEKFLKGIYCLGIEDIPVSNLNSKETKRFSKTNFMRLYTQQSCKVFHLVFRTVVQLSSLVKLSSL
jgi:hypothetical protein